VTNGDGLTITYSDPVTGTGATNVAISATAMISTTTAIVEFDKDSYEVTDSATVTVTEPDGNANNQLIESLTVFLFSATDPGGLTLTGQETGVNTGVFTTTFTFSTTSSAGTMLLVSPGDTITSQHRDATAAPADIPGWVPGIATLLFISDTALAGIPVTPEIPIESAAPAVEVAGEAVASTSVGTMVSVATTLTNTAPSDQALLYIVQIKDETGAVVSLSYISGTIPGGYALTLGIPWTPATAGTYTIDAYAWASWDDPSPLSLVSSSTIAVT